MGRTGDNTPVAATLLTNAHTPHAIRGMSRYGARLRPDVVVPPVSSAQHASRSLRS